MLTWPAATPAATAEDDLQAWLSDHAPDGKAAIAFVERRASDLVEGEVVTRGTLRFVPPDRLEKHVTEPHAATQVITADRVTLTRGVDRRYFPLDRAPALAALRQALLGWLTADAGRLREHFETELATGETGWTLTLTPRTDSLAEHLEGLVLTGDRNGADRMVTRMADGEVITTEFGTTP